MTKSERRKQSQLNGQKSFGPKTEAGKEKSSQNSLKHGFTALEFTLPGESTEAIQAEADRWFEALQPVDHDEKSLVDRVAIAAIHLQRLSRAEAVIVSGQVLSAENRWEADQEIRVIAARKLAATEPALALVELKSFSKGAFWLLGEWQVLQSAFEMQDSFCHYETIRHALRLQGYDPRTLNCESFRAHEFTTRALACQASCEKNFDYQWQLHESLPLGNRYAALHSITLNYDRDESAVVLREWIASEINAIKQLIPSLVAIDTEALTSAEARAMVPADTHETRMIHRYTKQNEMSLDRTLKTLMKIKKEREKELDDDTQEVPKPDFRNEPTVHAKSSANPVHPGACVTMNKKVYEVCETGDGCIYLAPKQDEPVSDERKEDSPDSEAVSTPDNGV